MEVVIAFLVGLLAGCIVILRVSKPKHVGTLRIDSSDVDGPYMFLELDKGVGDISKEAYVHLKVSNDPYISRD